MDAYEKMQAANDLRSLYNIKLSEVREFLFNRQGKSVTYQYADQIFENPSIFEKYENQILPALRAVMQRRGFSIEEAKNIIKDNAFEGERE